MKKLLLSSAILSVLSLNVAAETPSFNYAKLGYTDSSDYDMSSGLELKGNFELSDNLYLNGEFTTYDSMDGIYKFTQDFYTVGLGFKTEISRDTAFFTHLDYASLKSKFKQSAFGGHSTTLDGILLGAGIRSNVAKNLELSAAVNYLDLEKIKDKTRGEFTATYHFTDAFSGYASIETDFDDSDYAAGIQFSF